MGIDDGYDEDFDDDGGFEDELDDDGPPKKKRVATSTKIVLVVAGWLLLTLFLVGEFSSDKTPAGDTASARLDAVDAGASEDEVAIDEVLALEEFDSDGDGLLSDTERAAAVQAYEAAVASGDVATGEPWRGVTGGSATATEERAGEAAAPAASPTAGSGAASGGASSTSTTTKAPGGAGGGGGSTTTTTVKAGGATTTTTTTSPTTTTTAAPPPPPPSAEAETYLVTASGKKYVYGGADTKTIVVLRGSTITFDNTEGNNSILHSFTIEDGWDSGLIRANDPAETSPALSLGTYQFSCENHDAMKGTLRVT